MTEEGIYIARTYTVDDPNFKQKIDEERPRTEFKSSISPKLATIMLNFLNLFENRPNKKIIDPFIGNGTIAMFGIIENFQIFGSDKDKQKVEASKMNIKWLLKELGSETVPYLDDKIKVAKISELSKVFKEYSFDGIATEPDLGEFYTSQPYYTEAISDLKDKLEPLYQDLFREAYKILKPNARLCLMAPSISVLDDQKDIRLNIVNMANNFKFEMIPLISSNRIVNKSNIRLQFRKDEIYSILDAKDRQVVKRKLYVFEKQE
jgi:tRNA G10  N-methylase Trm11